MGASASQFDLEAQARTTRLAPIGARIVALPIDALVLLPLLLTQWIDVDLTLTAAVANLYFLLCTAIGWSRLGGGQTIGMRVMHIRVLRSDGSRLSLRRALPRYVVLWLSFLLLGIPLLLVGVTKRQQAFHDVLADTVVVAT